MDITQNGIDLIELAPDVTFEYIQELTGIRLNNKIKVPLKRA